MNDLIAVEKIAQWQKLKTLVLDSVYNMALEEFYNWFQQAPRPGFTKATVSAWRVSLEARGLGSSSIIIRMSAIRKLAAEAADNGLLAPEIAAGISRAKSVKSTGIRVGNWLSVTLPRRVARRGRCGDWWKENGGSQHRERLECSRIVPAIINPCFLIAS